MEQVTDWVTPCAIDDDTTTTVNSIHDTNTLNCLKSILRSNDVKQNGILARNVHIRLKLVPSKCFKSEFCYRCCQSRQVKFHKSLNVQSKSRFQADF